MHVARLGRHSPRSSTYDVTHNGDEQVTDNHTALFDAGDTEKHRDPFILNTSIHA
jgi:hypothetical protein